MATNLFNSLQKPNPMMQQFAEFQKNPFQFLVQKNVQIPQEYQQDPKGAVQYLLNNGKMSQNQFNQLNSIANQMGIKLT